MNYSLKRRWKVIISYVIYKNQSKPKPENTNCIYDKLLKQIILVSKRDISLYDQMNDFN
jgi:hypothetical protein